MITEKISNGGVLSGTINASSNLTMGIGSSNNLVGGNINTFTKEIDPTIPDYIKAISKEDIAGWDNNAVVNEEQNKTLIGLEELIDIITPKNTVKGELVHITDALGLPTFENKVDGNVKQETTKGNQLANFKYATFSSYNNTDIIDGKLIVPSDFTDGKTVRFFFDSITLPSGNYCFYINFKNYGTENTQPLLDDGSKEFGTFMFKKDKYSYCDITLNETTTINCFKLWVGASFLVGSELNEISLIKGTHENITTYEKFTNGASPNPSYPQEIEVLEAYNFFNHNVAKNDCIVDSKTGEITITKDTTDIYIQGAFVYNENNKFMTLEKGSYCIGSTNPNVRVTLYGDNGSLDTTFTQPITNDSTINYGGIRVRSTNGQSLLNQKFGVVINKGSYLKPYLPYGCVGYKVIGNNFCKTTDCNISDTNYGCIIQNGEIKINSTNTNNNFDICGGVRTGEWIQGYEKATDYFLTPKGGTYVIKLFIDEISGSGNGSNQLIIHTNKQKIIRYFSTTSTDITAKISLENDEYIKQVAIWTNSTLIIKIKGKVLLEQDLITSWEPYKEQIIYLDLKGNWVGKINNNIRDYLVTDKKKFWLVKTIKRFIVDETHLRGMNNFWYTLVDYLHLPKPEDYIGYNRYTTHDILMDRFYEYAKFPEQETFNAVGSFIPGQGATAIALVFPKGTSLEEAKAKTLGTAVYYKLATPEIIELGELPEPIKTFEGTNNIQVLANLDTEIEVKHALDVKKYADDRYLELTNALVSTGANL